MQSDSGRFDEADQESAVRLISAALASDGGERWCNLTLELTDDAPTDSPLFSFLAARGPSSPFATVMGATAGKRPRPAEIGLQHKAGPRAVDQLRDAGLTVPEGWQVVQDHPRRGLVITLPDPVSAADVGEWVRAAMGLLNRAPTTGRVLYQFFSS